MVSTFNLIAQESRHAGTTWRGATTEKHVLRQEVRAELLSRRSDVPYRPGDWEEGTSNEIVSNHASFPTPHWRIHVHRVRYALSFREDLGAQISVAAERKGGILGIFQSVRNSMQRLCQA
ncbi:hypothetical protein TNCV_165851 [Trichonephila clavipes]|nr:hypothetical protein TNCV_165851 [Trichonephila clavipes]